MIIFEEEMKKIPIIDILQRVAKNLNYNVYVVGGYVRDLFLGIESKDIDFTCEGKGILLAKEVRKMLGNDASLSYFKNFGTAMIKYCGYEYEFVGARKESYQRGSRKPIVEEGTLHDDIARRDFTINALAIKINKNELGTLIDNYNGVQDILKKKIKTPLEPNRTFNDDPLRIMRAIRFAAKLDFDIDADTYASITAKADRLSIISKERISTELNKIIMSKKPSYGFKLMLSSNVLKHIFPEMVELKGVETRDGKSHKDNFYHTLEVLDNIAKYTDNLWLRWAAILHDIAKPATKRFHQKAGWTFHGHEDKGSRMVPKIFKRFNLPLGQPMKYVQKLVLLHLRPIALVKDEVTDSAVRRLLFDAGDDINDLMQLCRADITSKNERKVKQYLNNFNIVEKKLKEVEEKDKLRNFQPVITGEIIMKTFNLRPSTVIGEIKVAVREAILDGKINNNMKEAYPFMVEIGKSMSLSPVEDANQ